MEFMKMFLKKWWRKKYNYFKGKADFYYARYQEEEKKEIDPRKGKVTFNFDSRLFVNTF